MNESKNDRKSLCKRAFYHLKISSENFRSHPVRSHWRTDSAAHADDDEKSIPFLCDFCLCNDAFSGEKRRPENE